MPENAFQYIYKLSIFAIFETSEVNMQEKMPPISLWDSGRTSFSKSDNNLGLRMRKSKFCFAVCHVLSWRQ